MKKVWVDKLKGQGVLFYLFVGYIFIFLFWWSYLLYTRITEVAAEKIKLLELSAMINGNTSVENQIQLIESELMRQHIMVIAEGLTFFIILLLVAYRLKKSINRDLEIARQQKNFLLSITHELKSPIASASLNIETLSKRQLSDDKKILLLENSTKELNRLNELVNRILLASKMESRFFSIDIQDFNLSELCRDVVENFREKEENTGRLDNVKIENGIFFKGDQTLLRSLFINIIDNALKYSESDKAVKIELSKVEQQVIFKVADQGKGISDKDKKYIFEKFYRAGNEETRTHTGTGLGLYLVNQIVQIHKGKIAIGNNPSGKGTVFEITLNL